VDESGEDYGYSGGSLCDNLPNRWRRPLKAASNTFLAAQQSCGDPGSKAALCSSLASEGGAPSGLTVETTVETIAAIGAYSTESNWLASAVSDIPTEDSLFAR